MLCVIFVFFVYTKPQRDTEITQIKETGAAASDQAACRFQIFQRRDNDCARRSDRRRLAARAVRFARSPRERSTAFLVPHQHEGSHPSDLELVLPADRNLPLPEPCRDLSDRFHVESTLVRRTRSEVKRNVIVLVCRVSAETERGGCRVHKRRRTGLLDLTQTSRSRCAGEWLVVWKFLRTFSQDGG